MNTDMPQADGEILQKLVSTKMPFGRYKDTLICDLPEFYIEWFQRKGFPKGKLGALLETMYDINLNGLRGLLEPLKRKY